jgi:hypothetical protein
VTWVDVPGSTFDPVRHGLSSFIEVAQIARRVRSAPVQPVPLRSAPVHPFPMRRLPVDLSLAAESVGS